MKGIFGWLVICCYLSPCLGVTSRGETTVGRTQGVFSRQIDASSRSQNDAVDLIDWRTRDESFDHGTHRVLPYSSKNGKGKKGMMMSMGKGMKSKKAKSASAKSGKGKMGKGMKGMMKKKADDCTTEPSPEKTKSPSTSPVKGPTRSPVKAPTKQPTAPTTNAPVVTPTNAPVPPPTNSPVVAPTNAPVVSPTNAPVPPPTNPPVVAPTDAPVPPPTSSPVVAPTNAPIVTPTDAPVPPPTNSPVVAPTSAPIVAPTDAPAAPPTDGTCTCQPRCLTFRFTPSATCDDLSLTDRPGLVRSSCEIEPAGNAPVTNLVPTVLSNVQFATASRMFDAGTRNDTVAGNVAPGETFEFCFDTTDLITGDPFLITNWGLFLFGINAQGDVLVNGVFVVFTNECDVFPVITAGDQLGWLSVVDVTGPSGDTCPAAIV